MSAGWNWFVIITTLLSMLACFWLIVWSNRQHQASSKDNTTGHSWDGLTELNNPLPMWWLGLFIITLLFSAVYLVLYPGLGNYGGTYGWSQADQYDAEVAAAEQKYGPVFASFGAMSVEELQNEPKALAIGQSLFANYCSQCHGSLGYGARGFPNLTDDDWLYGGSPAQIEQSILAGRTGAMPALGAALGGDEQVDAMVSYVQGLSAGVDTASPAHAQYQMFCAACHAADGTGMHLLGAPNLADDIWLFGSSDVEVRRTIVEGRSGVMPAHRDLIGDDRARILSAYVYSLSGSNSD